MAGLSISFPIPFRPQYPGDGHRQQKKRCVHCLPSSDLRTEMTQSECMICLRIDRKTRGKGEYACVERNAPAVIGYKLDHHWVFRPRWPLGHASDRSKRNATGVVQIIG
ncbi:hypothetical protein HNY73_001373 [Argiope bruennichi]|uniref:Uncharacterized protein n=1 Tax=Argiope bruennichi TaxID=94029 RepID=A0A8T0G288_ARGBR|nr:hypothetical protein HNY73_001373 [Argiope bruennichi]